MSLEFVKFVTETIFNTVGLGIVAVAGAAMCSLAYMDWTRFLAEKKAAASGPGNAVNSN